jgi:hypothetical protein
MSIVSALIFKKIKDRMKKENVLISEMIYINLITKKCIVDNKPFEFKAHEKEIENTIKEMKVTDLAEILITPRKCTLKYINGIKHDL